MTRKVYRRTVTSVILAFFMLIVSAVALLIKPQTASAATAYDVSYTADFSHGLPNDWATNGRSTLTDLYTPTQTSNGVIIGTNYGSNPGQSGYWGSMYKIAKSMPSVNDFTLEVKFRWNHTAGDYSRWFGITYHTEYHYNGRESGYMTALRMSGESHFSAFSGMDYTSSVWFSDDKDVNASYVPGDYAVTTDTMGSTWFALKIEVVGERAYHYLKKADSVAALDSATYTTVSQDGGYVMTNAVAQRDSTGTFNYRTCKQGGFGLINASTTVEIASLTIEGKKHNANGVGYAANFYDETADFTLDERTNALWSNGTNATTYQQHSAEGYAEVWSEGVSNGYSNHFGAGIYTFAPELKNLANFTLEMELTMTYATDPTRWFGIMYHAQDDASGALTGYVMNYRQNGNTAFSAWGPTTYYDSEQITMASPASQKIKVTIMVLNEVAYHYVNDVPVSSFNLDTLALGSNTASGIMGNAVLRNGGFKLLISGGTVYPSSLTINGVQTPDEYGQIRRSDYTDLEFSPAVVSNVDSKADYSALSSYKADSAILTLGKDGDNLVVLDSNENTIADLATALKYVRNYATSVVRIEDSDLVTSFHNFLSEYINDPTVYRATASNGNLYTDLAVMSSSTDILKAVRQQGYSKDANTGLNTGNLGVGTTVRGILDLSDEDYTTRAQWQSAVEKAHSNWANVVVLNEKSATREATEYIQGRLKTVWVQQEKQDDYSEFDTVKLVSNGVYGIVTDDPIGVYDAYSLYANDGNPLCRAPMNIAHRGIAGVTENSLKGYQAAYEAGATYFEIDTYVTLDGEVVLMHNPTINFTTTYDATTGGSGTPLYVEDMYYHYANAEAAGRTDLWLGNYKVDMFVNGSEPTTDASKMDDIPAVRTLFEEFHNKDIVYAFEIKPTYYTGATAEKTLTINDQTVNQRLRLVTAIRDLINEFAEAGKPVKQQIFFITFDSIILEYCRDLMPDIPTAYLSPLDSGWGAQLNCAEDLSGGSRAHTEWSKDRGYMSYCWTYNSPAATETAYINYGTYGITTNYADTITSMPRYLDAKPEGAVLADENSINTGYTMNFRSENRAKPAYTSTAVSLHAYQYFNDNNSFSAVMKATATSTNEGINYTLYSKAIDFHRLSVTESLADTGSLSGISNNYFYQYGTPYSLTITAEKEGYQIGEIIVNGETIPVNAKTYVLASVVTDVTSIQVNYEEMIYEIDELPSEVTITDAKDSYEYGSVVSATAALKPADAVEDVSYRLSAVRVNGQAVAFDAQTGAFNFTVLKDSTIEVEYKVTYAITINVTGNGSVTVDNTAYSGRYDADSTIKATVSAVPGNRLVTITVNGEEASVFGGKITFTLTQDTQIDAVFEEYQSYDAEEMFTMQMYGSSIRLYTSSATRYSGIQFRAVIREDQYSVINEYYFGKNTPRVDQVDENTTTETSYFMGLKVIPRYALGSGELLYNTANTLGGGWHNAKWTSFEDNPDITEDDIYAQGSYLQGVYRLYDLPEWAYIYDVVARSYIQEQIVTIVVNDDGTTSKTTTTNVYYTDTLEISMAQVATNYVQKYEDSNNSVYGNPVLLNAANDYRPDHYLIYSDGEEQVRELAQWGDTVTRDENLSEITYSKTVFTLPAQKGYTKDGNAQTFRGILSGGKYLMTNDVGSVFTPLTIKDDVNVFCLYTLNSKLIQKFDLETSRDAAIKFQDIPLDREIYSISFKDSGGNTVFSANTTANSALVYGGSVAGWNGEVFDATGMSLADFYNSATATLTLPKQIAQSMVDNFNDYGDDKFSVEILAGSTDVNNPDYVMYETTGALCSMKIATETDLYNWGKVAKTDYLNMMDTYQTIDGGKYAYSIDSTDLDASGNFKADRTRGVEATHDENIDKQLYNEFRWGGYFVLANDIECTEGNVYESFIDVTMLSWSYMNGYALKPGSNWANGRMYGFHGTFDGRGYNINNISIATHNYNEKDGTVKSAFAGGFIGLLGKEGIIKHVSFTNAEQKFAGGFVNSAGCGSVEGVYVHIDKVDKQEIESSDRWSGVFFGRDSMWEANIEHCFVNVTEDLTGLDNYYAIGYIHPDYGQLKQVFAVGGNYNEDHAFKSSGVANNGTYAEVDVDVKGVDYDTYQTYDNMRAANIDFSSWTADGFWAVRNGLPYPKRLDVDMQSVTLADSRFVEGALVSNYYPSMRVPYYEIDSRFGYLDINQEAKDAGCTVTYSTDNVLIIDIIEGMAIDKLDILVRSAYSGEISFKREIKIVQAVTEFIEEYNSFDPETNTYVGAGVNGGSRANPAIDVSQYESVYGGLSAFNYFGTTNYSGFATTYDANAKTLTYPANKFNMSTYGDSGKQIATFVANDTGTATASKIYALGAAPVVLVTQEINNGAELQNWLGVAKALHANDAEIGDHYWGGYFVLGNDIDFLDETVRACNNSSCANYGTTDCTAAVHRSDYGNKYAIKYAKTSDDACSHYKSEGGWITNWHDVVAAGFGGTFDGYGHTIDRYDSYGIAAGGFIGLLHTEGVIRNLNFTNAVFGGISGFLTHTVAGTIENVYIELKTIKNGSVANPAGIFFSADKLTHYTDGSTASTSALYEFGGLTSTGKIRNCFAKFTGTTGLNATLVECSATNATLGYAISVIGGNAMVGSTIENVFMVGGVTGYYKTLYRNASGATEATPTAFNDFGYFETKDAWINAGGANAYSGMGSYWIEKDGMPYPKTMYKGDSSETNANDIF